MSRYSNFPADQSVSHVHMNYMFVPQPDLIPHTEPSSSSSSSFIPAMCVLENGYNHMVPRALTPVNGMGEELFYNEEQQQLPMVSQELVPYANFRRPYRQQMLPEPLPQQQLQMVPQVNLALPQQLHTPNNFDTTLMMNEVQNILPEDSAPAVSSVVPAQPTLPKNVMQQNISGTVYFYSRTTGQNSIESNSFSMFDHRSTYEQYLYPRGHFYPGIASNIADMQPTSQLSSAFFMPATMRSALHARNQISNLTMDPERLTMNHLPLEVGNYHSLFPIESFQSLPGELDILCSTYRATHKSTGIKYCLRRYHCYHLKSAKCMILVNMWKKIQHSNIVHLREVFTTQAFSDTSFVLVYDYHAGCQTLQQLYLDTSSTNYDFQNSNSISSIKNNPPLIPESKIWSIVMQLTSGLRKIHRAGLACKTLHSKKIVVNENRIRISFCGTSDIINFDPNAKHNNAILNQFQQNDLNSLGHLVLSLTCRSKYSARRENLQSIIDMMSRHYSPDLRNLVLFLITPNHNRSIDDLMPIFGERFYTQLDALQMECDMQEEELSKEMENERLYRIMVKLNFINERTDVNMDPNWSETGDRYMLKLFRDYVFHCVTTDGRPWLDHAHIVDCLNKLDAGSMERVLLMSRDGRSVLIITYAELKNCFEKSFTELMVAAAS